MDQVDVGDDFGVRELVYNVATMLGLVVDSGFYGGLDTC